MFDYLYEVRILNLKVEQLYWENKYVNKVKLCKRCRHEIDKISLLLEYLHEVLSKQR